jgi:hypothetical protein
MAAAKFWSRGFAFSFGVTFVFGLLGGLYFLMISGLTERSNPIGSVFALVGLLLVLTPFGLLLGRFLAIRGRR